MSNSYLFLHLQALPLTFRYKSIITNLVVQRDNKNITKQHIMKKNHFILEAFGYLHLIKLGHLISWEFIMFPPQRNNTIKV